jgi:hypothetical protein
MQTLARWFYALPKYMISKFAHGCGWFNYVYSVPVTNKVCVLLAVALVAARSCLKCLRMMMYKRAAKSESVSKLDQAAPRQA